MRMVKIDLTQAYKNLETTKAWKKESEMNAEAWAEGSEWKIYWTKRAKSLERKIKQEEKEIKELEAYNARCE